MAMTTLLGRSRALGIAALVLAPASLLVLLLGLLLVPLSAVKGQATSPPQVQPRLAGPESAPPGGTDRQITIDVQVMDKSGAPIRGLQQENFTVLDEKQPQKLVSFHSVSDAGDRSLDSPVEIVLVVDTVNTPVRAVTYERDEVKKFLLQNGGKLVWPVSLAFFAETGIQMQNGPSRDGNALAALFDRQETGLRSANLTNGGRWSALQRLDVSIKALDQIVKYEKTRPGRKLVIWFSRGWPIFEWGAVHTMKDDQQIFDSITTESTNLRQARITLYSVDPVGLRNAGSMRNSYYEGFLKGVSSASRAQPGNMGLQVIATQSGGRVFTSATDLKDAIASCIADASAYYVLTFAAARADQANEYHSLQVTVDKPGMTARTRTGYYARP
jgi:VWFA-related protein